MTSGKELSFITTPFWEDPDPVLRSGKLGLLCNQTAWHAETGEYLFETLFRRGNLRRVFMPEHGLFGELQDQIKIDDREPYAELGFSDCEFVSLYGSKESSLSASREKLADLDGLIVDLQDVGVRYYTFLSTLRNLFITLTKESLPLPVWIIDRENPAGSRVEGSPLKAEYASFIGIEGIPHRHGLTIGEMAAYFYDEIGADFPLRVVSWKAASPARTASSAQVQAAVPSRTASAAYGQSPLSAIFPWTIPPSPNIPGFFTCAFYSGQCLWEGTNVSEGRGTTRPFEVFGAPWMEGLLDYNRKADYESWNDERHPLFDPGAALRWHRFIPTFHKYRDECCFGFQLVRRDHDGAYHALLHALRLIRFVGENCEGFSFRPGKYEAGNDKTAIELLAGDPVLLDYLRGETGGSSARVRPDRGGEGPAEKALREYFVKEEKAWIEKAARFRYYEDPLESAAAGIG